MSLSDTFHQTGPTPPIPPPFRRARPAPFSLRLSAAERARLEAEAGGSPLGAYIKEKLLGDAALKRRSRLSAHDRRALAQALALLGRSRIANNLNQLAHAANIGALPLTPDVEADLREAVAEVRELRRLIMAGLGSHQAGARP